ncbi:uncharacterized protein C7orf61 homolog isoform X2 [Mus pahari]|uniref:uncharacterized protein C7orf61 homolog isoform X2 n=1 Tax=Mus pahari TaxID=10093 RepID=UPI000A30CDB2|nr:uncharacterized protein C7orf61 homolog isoform X2 [Mus pahari]
MVMRFLKWIRQIWRKVPSWVLFWKHLGKPGASDQHEKRPLTGPEKASTVSDTVKLFKPHKEAIVADLDVCPGMLEPSVLASAKEKSPVHDQESHSNRDSRSLMTLVHSVSMFMFSMLQYGWRLFFYECWLSFLPCEDRVGLGDARG